MHGEQMFLHSYSSHAAADEGGRFIHCLLTGSYFNSTALLLIWFYELVIVAHGVQMLQLVKIKEAGFPNFLPKDE